MFSPHPGELPDKHDATEALLALGKTHPLRERELVAIEGEKIRARINLMMQFTM